MAKIGIKEADAMIRADMASIATAGGNENFKQLQANSANMKTAQSMKNVVAAKDAGFMDENGNITSKGMEAYVVIPGQQASQLSKLLDFANNPKGLERIRDKMNSDDPGGGDEWIASFIPNNSIPN